MNEEITSVNMIHCSDDGIGTEESGGMIYELLEEDYLSVVVGTLWARGVPNARGVSRDVEFGAEQ